MTFEAQTTLSPGRGVIARLDTARNRWTLEPCGTVSQGEIEAAAPALFQTLADRAQRPVAAMGATYAPAPIPTERNGVWGERA